MEKLESMRRQITVAIFSIFILFLIDIFTKNLAFLNLQLNTPLPVNNFINLTLVYNYGAAFSFLSDQGGWQRYFFIAASLIIIFILFVLLIKTENYNKTSLILIISGALGNLYDRISYGYVIDFIELHYNNFYWPIFNFADITISIGTMILLINIIFEKK